MGSAAHTALIAAVAEVEELRAAYPTGQDILAANNALARALGRSATVLLCSHFERYLYTVNEEATGFINHCGLHGDSLPNGLRLVHSRHGFDQIVEVGWENRTAHLHDLMQSDAWLWLVQANGMLGHEKLLSWMKSPKPQSIVRYFRYWGVDDIFSAITRKPQTRGALWFRVQELVDKRNNIAHGDFGEQATRDDVHRYITTVRTFCTRVDQAFSKLLAKMAKTPRPW
jgi:hypothetical protein